VVARLLCRSGRGGLLDRVDGRFADDPCAQWQRAFYARRVLAQEGSSPRAVRGPVVAQSAVGWSATQPASFPALRATSIGPWAAAGWDWRRCMVPR